MLLLILLSPVEAIAQEKCGVPDRTFELELLYASSDDPFWHEDLEVVAVYHQSGALEAARVTFADGAVVWRAD